MRSATYAFAAVLLAAWQISAAQVSPAGAQTVTAQPPQTDTLHRQSPMPAESAALIPDQQLDAAAVAIRAVTDQGLFAEEYDAILEAAQNDPQLREKIIKFMTAPAK